MRSERERDRGSTSGEVDISRRRKGWCGTAVAPVDGSAQSHSRVSRRGRRSDRDRRCVEALRCCAGRVAPAVGGFVGGRGVAGRPREDVDEAGVAAAAMADRRGSLGWQRRPARTAALRACETRERASCRDREPGCCRATRGAIVVQRRLAAEGGVRASDVRRSWAGRGATRSRC